MVLERVDVPTRLLPHLPDHLRCIPADVHRRTHGFGLRVRAATVPRYPNRLEVHHGCSRGMLRDAWNTRLLPHYALGAFFALAHPLTGLCSILLAHGVQRSAANPVLVCGCHGKCNHRYRDHRRHAWPRRVSEAHQSARSSLQYAVKSGGTFHSVLIRRTAEG